MIEVTKPLPAAPLAVRRRYLIVVPGPFPAAPRRSLQFAKAGSAAMLPQQEKSNSADVHLAGFVPRGDVPSASSKRYPKASRRARHRRRRFEA